MAIVETLEVRFQANLGNLKSQISGVIGKLGALSAVSERANAIFARSTAVSRDAVLSRVAAVQKDISVETKYQSKLKSTARIAKNTGKAIKKAAGSIGLHRLDEVNLLDLKKSSSSGSGSSSGAGGIDEAKDAAVVFWKVTKALGESIKDLGQLAKNSFSGLGEAFNRLTFGFFGGKSLGQMLKDKIAGALDDGFSGAAEESQAPVSAADKLATKFANSLRAKKVAASDAAKSVADAAVFSSESAKTEALEAGAELSQGFADGIASKQGAVKSSAASIASAALAKIRNVLNIHSPSKVTRAIGIYFGEGFSEGVAASVQGAAKSAALLSGSAANALGARSYSAGIATEEGGISAMMLGAVNKALGNTSLVIPLNVDGVKLGEASIRGINRVTRAAGRVLLEI